MKRRLLAATATLAALSIPNLALAQDNTIIVDGARVETADIRQTARDITEGVMATQEPLARYQRPICPGVWGLSAENAQPLVDRIIENARNAGVDVNEEPGCGANMWVIVTDDVGATFERLHEADSFMTRHLTRFQRRKVRDQEGNARAWNVISDRNENGERVASGFEYTAGYAASQAQGVPDPPANEISGASRLETGIRKDIELSVVLVERSAIANLDAYAIADYATMRLLAFTTPPKEEGEVGTVLTLFNPGASELAPQRLTVFDQAYLQALYRSDEMRPARIAIGNVQELMERVTQ